MASSKINQSDNILKKIEQVKLQETQDLTEVTTILKQNIVQSHLPASFFEHMAGIIVEEPPTNGLELYELIGQFVLNGNKVSYSDATKLCNTLYEILVKNNLIKSQVRSLGTERLKASVMLNKIELITDKDINNSTGYEDAFRGTKKGANTNDDINENDDDPELKQANAEQQQKGNEPPPKNDLYERFKKDMDQKKQTMPKMQVNHHKVSDIKSMDIKIDNLTLIVGGKELLQETKLQLVYGQKYGLIGRNGIGKTCLMNAIYRREYEKINPNIQILLVEQEIVGDMRTPLDWVLQTDSERSELLKEMDLISEEKDARQIDSNRLVEINHRLEEIEAHDAENRALTILAGLGFTQQMVRNPTKNLSGGWRMRVTLARALFVKPDILLLDEPTNHLDLDAVMWLEDYLLNCKQTVVIVSHARDFLNVVCNKIIHFYDFKLTYYDGNYDMFEKNRSEDLRNQKKTFETQQAKVAHMQTFIDKFRYNAKRASLVQSRIKAINKMDLIDEVVEDPNCVFIFPTAEKLRPPLLKLEDASFGYKQSYRIIKGANFNVDCESRIAVVGANGAGKSTLLKLLIGELQPKEGLQYRNPRLRVSMFTQHHIDQLDLSLSPLEQFKKDFPGQTGETYRAHLGSFGITGNLQLRPNYLLSGGQKSRVAFAAAVFNNPHILVLDEPTNHLDIDAVNALIIALNNFTGGILIVSHDQHLVSTVCDQIFYVKEQRLKQFNGDFEDYRTALASGQL